jgi:transcriptional regulator with XRE-family HTH domain
MNDKELLGKIREQMQESGIIFKELAAKLKIELASVSSFLSGRHKPQKTTIKRYLNALREFPQWPKDFEEKIKGNIIPEESNTILSIKANIQALGDKIVALEVNLESIMRECAEQLKEIRQELKERQEPKERGKKTRTETRITRSQPPL